VSFIVMIHDDHAAVLPPWLPEGPAGRAARAEGVVVGRIRVPSVDRVVHLGETWVLARDHAVHVGAVRCSTDACIVCVVDSATAIVRAPTDREFSRLMALDLQVELR
jgi:hypothetical protein